MEPLAIKVEARHDGVHNATHGTVEVGENGDILATDLPKEVALKILGAVVVRGKLSGSVRLGTTLYAWEVGRDC